MVDRTAGSRWKRIESTPDVLRIQQDDCCSSAMSPASACCTDRHVSHLHMCFPGDEGQRNPLTRLKQLVAMNVLHMPS